MAHFPLCPDCQREYEDPLDRRFHAQPVACPVCGPQVALDSGITGGEAIREAVQAVREGRILAVGAHLKNTIALSVGRQVFLSQHIGDLDSPEACAAFERVIADFLRLYEVGPMAIAHDLHPDYFSTKYATSHIARSTSHIPHPTSLSSTTTRTWPPTWLRTRWGGQLWG